jgi:hypothetical protein
VASHSIKASLADAPVLGSVLPKRKVPKTGLAAVRALDQMRRSNNRRPGNALIPMTNPIALSIPEVCKTSGFGKTKIYKAIKQGDLVARKYGRRTVVLYEDLVEFLRNLPRTRR